MATPDSNYPHGSDIKGRPSAGFYNEGYLTSYSDFFQPEKMPQLIQQHDRGLYFYDLMKLSTGQPISRREWSVYETEKPFRAVKISTVIHGTESELAVGGYTLHNGTYTPTIGSAQTAITGCYGFMVSPDDVLLLPLGDDDEELEQITGTMSYLYYALVGQVLAVNISGATEWFRIEAIEIDTPLTHDTHDDYQTPPTHSVAENRGNMGRNFILLIVRPFNTTLLAGATGEMESVVSAVEGKTLPIVSSAFAGGTAQPDPDRNAFVSRDFTTQIIKATGKIEGHVIDEKMWFSTQGSDGNNSLWSQLYLRPEMNMDKYIEGIIVTGQPNTAGLTTASFNTRNKEVVSHGVGNVISTAKGLTYWQERNGWTLEVDSTTGIQLSDLDAIGNKLVSLGCNGGDVLMICGNTFKSGVDSLGVSLVSAANGGDAIFKYVDDLFGIPQISATFNFGIVNKGNFKFIFIGVASFSNPDMFGADALGFDNTCFVMPKTQVPVIDKDKNAEIRIPNAQMNNVSMNGYDRGKRFIWMQGATGKETMAIGDVDATSVYMRQDISPQFVKTIFLGRINVV